MKFSNQIICLTGIATMAIGCSSYHRMESVDDKMGRYQSKRNIENPVPKISAKETTFSRSRGPASYDLSPKTNYTNKQLYFMTLYAQYEQLGKYSNAKIPEIKSCPGNHTAWLNYKNKYMDQLPQKTLAIKFNTDPKTWSDDYKAKYPELQLPVTMESATPTVADIIAGDSASSPKDLLDKALNIHLAKTYSEIKQLCDYGMSDNYYAFENLISEVNKTTRFTASTENMQVLLKTTLFTNISLIKSFEGKKSGRSIASHKEDTLTEEVMIRVKAPWAKEYFKKMQGL